jgi:probable HAF family extracellular repeat protein
MLLRTPKPRGDFVKRLAFQAVALLTLVACDEPTPPAAPRSPPADVALGPSSRYAITDIGTLGGTFTQVSRINENGQVVGGSTTSSGDLHAFLWTQGSGMIDLGTLLGSTGSFAWGINDRGDVAGEADLPSGDTRAVLWTADHKIQDLGTLGGPSAVALGINNGGEVVGFSTLATGEPTHGFVWTAQGGMVDAGTFNGTNTRLRTIDNSGTTGAGSGNLASNGNARAVLWHPTTGFQDLGDLGEAPSYAARINGRGEVVGFSSTTLVGCCHAFLWTSATGMVDLGTLNGPGGLADAFDITDNGQVTGSTTTPTDPNNSHAYVWSRTAGMQQLPDLPGEIDSGGLGINDVGQIIGFADTPDGSTHGVLWTPMR